MTTQNVIFSNKKKTSTMCKPLHSFCLLTVQEHEHLINRNAINR